MAFVKIKNFSYRYPYAKKKALIDVSCNFEKGGFYGVIGQNGSGKTTLCNAVRGLVPHFYKGDLEGNLFVDDIDVRQWNVDELSVKIGYVFQNPFTQISGVKETVFEEIALGLENMGVEKKKMINTVLEVCKQLDIESLLEKNPNELSGGQRQRVAFASIIAMNCEMMVIDEPTSQLDPQGTEDVFKIIETLKNNGKTIILVEHKVNLIARYCDKVIVMEKGRIVFNDDVDKVLTNPELVQHGARLPEVANLGIELEKKGKKLEKIPITVEEAVPLIEKRKRGVQSGD